MNLPALQAQSRLQSDIKATKTIAFTVAAYFACYVPTISYAVAGQQDGSQTNSWFSFFAWFALFFSSAVNPIIYYVRSRRFRCAFKQFIKDPFGSSDLQEKSSGPREAREKRNSEDAAIPRENGNQEGNGYQGDEDQALKNYHGQQRGGMMILSMQALLSCAIDNGGSSRKGRAKQQKGEASGSTSSFPEPVLEQKEACASNHQIKEPNEDMCEEIEELFLTELDNGYRKESNFPGELVDNSGYRPEENREVLHAQCPEEEIPQQSSSNFDIQESATYTPKIIVDKFHEVLEEKN